MRRDRAMSMLVWHERSPEEAHHFNPAYCGALVYEFVRSYTNAKEHPPLFPLVFCAMPIALHPDTRDRLPSRTIPGLYPWIENNPEALVGFADRAPRAHHRRRLVVFSAGAESSAR